MTEKQFIIPQSMVSALLAYLQTRPYQEVAQAIPALMSLPLHQPVAAVEEGSTMPHNPDFNA